MIRRYASLIPTDSVGFKKKKMFYFLFKANKNYNIGRVNNLIRTEL